MSTTASGDEGRRGLRTGVPAVLAAVGFLLLSGCAMISTSEDVAVRELDDSYNGVKVIDLRNHDGTTRIAGGDTEDVRLRRTQTYTGDAPPGEKVSADAGTLKIEAGRCENGFSIGLQRCDTDYTVTVPHGTKITLRSDDGDVTVEDPRADIDVESRGGAISASGEMRDAVLRSEDGAVDLDGIDAADIDVRTRDGDLTATGSADSADLRAQDGNLDLDGLDATELAAATRDGDITIRTDAPFTSLAATTTDGGIDVTAAEAFDRIEATARDGDITVHTPVDGGPYAVSTDTRDGAVDVAVPEKKGADSTIDATATDGDVTIRER